MPRKIRIGIIGSSENEIGPSDYQIAVKLGNLIADEQCDIVTGASIGVPHLTLLKAREKGSKAIGFSPDSTPKSHPNRLDNAPLTNFDKVFFIKGFTKRSLKFISFCDAIIVIGGRMGTLSEYTIAFEEKKPIGVFTLGNGISKYIENITLICNKHRDEPVFFHNNIGVLFKELIDYLKRN